MTAQPQKLAIYGASHFMLLKLLDAINRQVPTWELLGFLDDAPGLQGQQVQGYPVLGGAEILPRLVEEGVHVFNNVVATPASCQVVATRILASGCQVPNLIHPAIDMAYVEIGRGCLLTEACVVGANARLGNFISVRLHSVLSHDVQVGDFAIIGPGVTVAGKAKLGQGCFIGAGATILPEITVGDYAVVGAGSVVTHEVPPYATVAGVPARPLKPREMP